MLEDEFYSKLFNKKQRKRSIHKLRKEIRWSSKGKVREALDDLFQGLGKGTMKDMKNDSNFLTVFSVMNTSSRPYPTKNLTSKECHYIPAALHGAKRYSEKYSQGKLDRFLNKTTVNKDKKLKKQGYDYVIYTLPIVTNKKEMEKDVKKIKVHPVKKSDFIEMACMLINLLIDVGKDI